MTSLNGDDAARRPGPLFAGWIARWKVMTNFIGRREACSSKRNCPTYPVWLVWGGGGGVCGGGGWVGVGWMVGVCWWKVGWWVGSLGGCGWVWGGLLLGVGCCCPPPHPHHPPPPPPHPRHPPYTTPTTPTPPPTQPPPPPGDKRLVLRGGRGRALPAALSVTRGLKGRAWRRLCLGNRPLRCRTFGIAASRAGSLAFGQAFGLGRGKTQMQVAVKKYSPAACRLSQTLRARLGEALQILG